MLERSKRLPGHAEKLYTLLNTNAHDCNLEMGHPSLKKFFLDSNMSHIYLILIELLYDSNIFLKYIHLTYFHIVFS